MSMNLTTQDLQAIADAVEMAGKASFEVESIKVGDHRVMLAQDTTAARNAGEKVYRIVGITTGNWSGGMGNLNLPKLPVHRGAGNSSTGR